jgi:DNA-directed RNA polymerase subunit RPC12/RpoP
LSQYCCPRCKTPVVVPEGQPGVLCPNCHAAVMLEDIQRQPQPRRGSPALRIILVAAILAMVGVWLYVGPLAPEPGVNLTGESRATSVTPRRFVLWELHADDTIRVVELLTQSRVEKGLPYQVCGQTLRPEDDILSQEWIGGRLTDKHIFEEVYHGKTYLRTCYWLSASSNHYGYDMHINHPPHLHIRDNERLISLGIEPKSYAQEIIVVAIPVNARLMRIYDYQPYRHITLEGWDAFYYDTTEISKHVSIHITYRPGDDVPPLDWATVEASR